MLSIAFLACLALVIFVTCTLTKNQSLLVSSLWAIAGILLVCIAFFNPLDKIYDKNIFSLATIGSLCIIVFTLLLKLHGNELSVHNKKISALLNKQNEKVEDERRRIAGLLHDEINPKQLLAKMALNRLRNKNPSMSLESMEILAQAEKFLEEAYQEVRNIINLTRVEIFDSIGLLQAIEDLVNNYKKVIFNVSIEFHCNASEITAHDSHLIVAYRIIQEALLNAIKHSKSNKIDVSITEKKTTYSIIIKDNGLGFDPESIISNGVGMTDMTERAISIGSKLDIKSTAYSGTEIKFTLLKKL